jgi:hypothetical protein
LSLYSKKELVAIKITNHSMHIAVERERLNKGTSSYCGLPPQPRSSAHCLADYIINIQVVIWVSAGRLPGVVVLPDLQQASALLVV